MLLRRHREVKEQQMNKQNEVQKKEQTTEPKNVKKSAKK